MSDDSAGFGRRLAALIYDALLVAALLMVFTFAALPFTHGAAVVPETAGVWAYVYRAGLMMVIAAYYVINWLRSGQTLGMRAWRLRTVSESGEPLALTAAALRMVFGVLAWTPAALGVLWLYLDRDHLALHDRLSRTRVVHWNTSKRRLARSRNRDERAESDHGSGQPTHERRIDVEKLTAILDGARDEEEHHA